MARIRSIHPGLFTDEDFMGLTVRCPLAVTLLLGLWTEADDAGAFQWKPMVIKARVLPAATEDIGALLEELVRAGFVMKYEIDGREYGAVRNFMRWQRPKKPKIVHPMTETVRTYVGHGTEPVPHQYGIGGEIPPQREEEGGRKKEEEEESASAASSSRAPVSEPEKPVMSGLTDCEREIARAFHEHNVDPSRFPPIQHAAIWQAQGYDPAICRAVVSDALRRGKAIRSLAWFDERIREAHEKRAPAKPPDRAGISHEQWETFVARHRQAPSKWPYQMLGPDPGQPGCKAPAEILNRHGWSAAA